MIYITLITLLVVFAVFSSVDSSIPGFKPLPPEAFDSLSDMAPKVLLLKQAIDKHVKSNMEACGASFTKLLETLCRGMIREELKSTGEKECCQKPCPVNYIYQTYCDFYNHNRLQHSD